MNIEDVFQNYFPAELIDPEAFEGLVESAQNRCTTGIG